MHDMRWVQTDYSSVLVRLSRLYESKKEAVPATDWGGVRPVQKSKIHGAFVLNRRSRESTRHLLDGVAVRFSGRAT